MQDIGLYANNSDHGGYICDAVARLAHDCYSIRIASAFFTDPTLVKNLTVGGASVRLVMRLGYPTNPKALFSMLGDEQVRMRFFTDRYFHPKLYIFDSDVALVGSANLTSAAFHANQEIMVALYSGDPRFAELELIFREYWDDARVLSPSVAADYATLWQRHDGQTDGVERLEEDVVNKFCKVSSRSIKRPGVKVDKSDRLYEAYKRDYQETVSAFNSIRSVYESHGKRKVPGAVIPLRLEVDSFISFVRDKHASGSNWSAAPLLPPNQRVGKIKSLVDEWHSTDWPYFESTIVYDNYPKLRTVFDSVDNITHASDVEIVDALTVLHSFLEHRRFEKGGLEVFKSQFIKKNGRGKINDTLSYLLFGPGEVERRMCECIYDEQYHLWEFGMSNVQELVGWLNNQELPVINLRTRKVLRYFGFDIWGD